MAPHIFVNAIMGDWAVLIERSGLSDISLKHFFLKLYILFNILDTKASEKLSAL